MAQHKHSEAPSVAQQTTELTFCVPVMTSKQPGSPMDPLGAYLGEEDMHRARKLPRMLCGNILRLLRFYASYLL